QLRFQAEVVDNVLGNGVAEEFVEVHASEARLLFGGLDIADVLVELDVVALLGVGQGSDGGLVLDFLLDDLFLEVGGVEFDQDLVGFEVLLGDLVAFFDDFEDFGSLVADRTSHLISWDSSAWTLPPSSTEMARGPCRAVKVAALPADLPEPRSEERR